MSTDERYISTERLRRLCKEPCEPAPDEKDLKRNYTLNDRLDHVGQASMMFVPGNMFGPETEFHCDASGNPRINLEAWEAIRESVNSGNYMYFAGSFSENAKNEIPTLSKEKVRVLFSVFHCMLNPENDEGRYYRGLVEKTFGILDIGKPMTLEELLDNTAQMKALSTACRESLGKL